MDNNYIENNSINWSMSVKNHLFYLLILITLESDSFQTAKLLLQVFKCMIFLCCNCAKLLKLNSFAKNYPNLKINKHVKVLVWFFKAILAPNYDLESSAINDANMGKTNEKLSSAVTEVVTHNEQSAI